MPSLPERTPNMCGARCQRKLPVVKRALCHPCAPVFELRLLRWASQEWSHPYFISYEDYQALALGTGAMEAVETEDWAEQARAGCLKSSADEWPPSESWMSSYTCICMGRMQPTPFAFTPAWTSVAPRLDAAAGSLCSH